MRQTINILLLLLLIWLLSPPCKSFSSEEKFKKEQETLNELNHLILENFDEIDKQYNIDFIKDSIQNAKILVEHLKNELNLTKIELYYINGDATELGVAYGFQNRYFKNVSYYMLFSNNPEKSESFASYEQFTDFNTKRTRIDANWTYSEIQFFQD